MKNDFDVVIIGGGPAGLAAACSAKENGAHSVLVIERDVIAGGILNQCIHNGFGVHFFKEELTGPEYASRFISKANQLGIEILLNTMVLKLEGHCLTACNEINGVFQVTGKAVILAMGCRERTREALAIPGDRPSGVFTAGRAQRYINIDGWMIGKRVVILGSGDIGLIMARRLTLEGAKVLACIELMPYCNGLNRNVVQCLNDYNIPLLLSHTITKIEGLHRVSKVYVSEVGADRKIVPGTEHEIECDTVLLSVGLIPENELTRNAKILIDPKTKGPVVYENMETVSPGVFSCGNVVQVHDLVDFVTIEAHKAGKAAAIYALGAHDEKINNTNAITVINGKCVNYTVPQKIHRNINENFVDISFRVSRPFDKSEIIVNDSEKNLCRFKRDYMSPGQMEHIRIPCTILQTVKSGEINIKINAEEAYS